MEEVLKHIDVSLSNLSAVDLVEDLEEDKGIEDVSVVQELVLRMEILLVIIACWACRIVVFWHLNGQSCGCAVFEVEDELAENYENGHDDGVVDGNSQDLPPNWWIENCSLLLLWALFDDSRKWWLS